MTWCTLPSLALSVEAKRCERAGTAILGWKEARLRAGLKVDALKDLAMPLLRRQSHRQWRT
jgi:hypothetical protein